MVMGPIVHCCRTMDYCIEDGRPFLKYLPLFRAYVLIRKGRKKHPVLSYCPWCGDVFPPPLRDEYIRTIQSEYGAKVVRGLLVEPEVLPSEFHTDEWWKKRNIGAQWPDRSMMENRDILHERYERKITEKQAHEIHRQSWVKFHQEALNLQGNQVCFLSRAEQAALFFHTMKFSTIARWRYEGWPSCCELCTEKIDFDQEITWRARERLVINGKNYKQVVVHWRCYDAARGKKE